MPTTAIASCCAVDCHNHNWPHWKTIMGAWKRFATQGIGGAGVSWCSEAINDFCWSRRTVSRTKYSKPHLSPAQMHVQVCRTSLCDVSESIFIVIRTTRATLKILLFLVSNKKGEGSVSFVDEQEMALRSSAFIFLTLTSIILVASQSCIGTCQNNGTLACPSGICNCPDSSIWQGAYCDGKQRL